MRWRWLALPAAVLLWALLGVLGLQPRMDRALGDLLLRSTAPQPAPASSVIVDIDDSALRALREPLGEWPYSREVYALMLGYLQQAGARLVVMDIVFAGPREGDERLAAALRDAPAGGAGRRRPGAASAHRDRAGHHQPGRAKRAATPGPGRHAGP